MKQVREKKSPARQIKVWAFFRNNPKHFEDLWVACTAKNFFKEVSSAYKTWEDNQRPSAAFGLSALVAKELEIFTAAQNVIANDMIRIKEWYLHQ